MYYKDSKKELGDYEITTSIVSATIISINLVSLYFILVYCGIVPSITNKLYVIILMILVWACNYFIFIRNQKFLNYNFVKDKIGGYLVVGFIILNVLFALSIALLHREQIRSNKTRIEVIAFN